MKSIKTKILSVLFIFTYLGSFSQSMTTIDSLEAKHQACLDKGEYMLGCAKTFYSEIDSLLNVEYQKLRLKCDSVQKANLKEEQLKWLAVRDKQFKINKKQVHKDAKQRGYDGGQDEAMILTDKNALFVRNRVIELMNKTPENYSGDKY